MSENSPEETHGVKHYCGYACSDCNDKFLVKGYCREFENGSFFQNSMYFSKQSNWDISRLQKDIDDLKLQETTDQATFCCKTTAFVAKVTVSSFDQKEFETELPVNVQKCSLMTGPPPHLPFTLSGKAARNMKTCIRITDEDERIILELPLHSKDFPSKSRKLPQENEEIEQEEHSNPSGEHEAPQQSGESDF